MKQLIKYAALLFALVLAASIIGGCLSIGVALVQGFRDEISFSGEWNNGSNEIWHRTEEGEVVFLGMKFGDAGKVKSGSETFAGSEIDSLNIEVGSGTLVVEAWDSNSILVEYENIPESYEFFVDGDTLVIERETNVFLWGQNFLEMPKIHVSVPVSMVFDEVEVDKGSGSATLVGLSAKVLEVDNGSGSLEIVNATAKESKFNSGSGSFTVKSSDIGNASMDAGSGSVNFEDIVAVNMVLDTGSGRVDVSGILTGNCVFESGSGSLNVVVYGEEKDYNFSTDMGSGSFYLNGRKEDDAELSIEHTNAKHLLMFDAGSGRVSLEFKEIPERMQETVRNAGRSFQK